MECSSAAASRPRRAAAAEGSQYCTCWRNLLSARRIASCRVPASGFSDGEERPRRPPWDSTCQTERERGGVGKAHDRPPLIGCHTVNRAT
jgi:hypothetical protein